MMMHFNASYWLVNSKTMNMFRYDVRYDDGCEDDDLYVYVIKSVWNNLRVWYVWFLLYVSSNKIFKLR